MIETRSAAEASARLSRHLRLTAIGVGTDVVFIANELNPKAQLLQLCARISYTPH